MPRARARRSRRQNGAAYILQGRLDRLGFAKPMTMCRCPPPVFLIIALGVALKRTLRAREAAWDPSRTHFVLFRAVIVTTATPI